MTFKTPKSIKKWIFWVFDLVAERSHISLNISKLSFFDKSPWEERLFRIQFYIRYANKKFWSTTFLRRGRVCESLTRNIPRHHEWQLEINNSWDFPKWKFINPSGLSPLPNIFLICQYIFHPFLLILSLFYMKYSLNCTGFKSRKTILKKIVFFSFYRYI